MPSISGMSMSSTHDVRVGAFDLAHGLAAGAQRGDHFEVGLGFDPAREQAADDDGVVHHHDADAPPADGGAGRLRCDGNVHTDGAGLT